MSGSQMPVTDKTPAPSRRFLPPSSSASNKQWTSSGRRPPFSYSQSDFTPSSTSLVTHTSRFQALAKAETEDIDTSFGDGASSPLASTRYGPYAVSDVDHIVEEDPLQAQGAAEGLETPSRQRSLSIEASPRSPKPGVQNRASSLFEDYADPVTPLPKRRKLSASSHLRPEDIIDISSSAEASEPLPRVHADQSVKEDVGDEALGSDGLSSSPEIVTPSMPTRFKTPMNQKDLIQTPQHRALFRTFAKDSRLNALAGHALPDAFSPSRQKGKKTYVAGGLADTVRTWVLNVATEESQRSTRAEKVLIPKKIVMDQSGRAIVIDDEHGDRWILVGDQQGHNAGSSATTLSRLRNGARVTVKGTSTSWTLPVAEPGTQRESHIATHWDVG